MRSLRFRCVRLNWRQFIFAAFLVSLSACGKKKSEEREGQSGKATQKSSETQSISEEQVCDRVAAFSHHGEQEELTSCKTRLTNMKEKMGKEKYEKFLACMVKASSKSEAKECAGTPGAFQNYVKRSKTAEVKVNLRLLHDGM